MQLCQALTASEDHWCAACSLSDLIPGTHREADTPTRLWEGVVSEGCVLPRHASVTDVYGIVQDGNCWKGKRGLPGQLKVAIAQFHHLEVWWGFQQTYR